MKTCVITGYIKTNDKEYIRRIIRYEIIRAVLDGHTHFISGLANWVDMEFAGLIAEAKKVLPSITLEAVIPYRSKLTERTNPKFQKLLGKCDKITVTSEEYSRKCYRTRNQYIVEKSDKIVAVFSGCIPGRTQRGGTTQIIRIAREKKRDIKFIRI